MGILVEEVSLRDKHHVFVDRTEAGNLLAEKLTKYKNSDAIILGIPSGGVPIASQIASALDLPMDLIIVRKIQIPYNPEAGFGAVGPEGDIILNERVLNQLSLTEREMNAQIQKTKEIIRRRDHLFRQESPFPTLKDKNIIVVDDGLASGYTMFAAIKFIKKKDPQKVIVGVPTGSERTVEFLLSVVDELVCLNVRGRFPFAVADAYRNWYDLSDEEVLRIIKEGQGNDL
jgi:putative phosphoribosyl transferase